MLICDNSFSPGASTILHMFKVQENVKIYWHGSLIRKFPRGLFWAYEWLLKQKFIHNEGARKVTMGIIIFLVKIYCQRRWFRSKIKRWLFTWDFSTHKRTSFSLSWYITTYTTFVLFWLKTVNFLYTLFHTSICISSLNMISKVWSIILLHVHENYRIFLPCWCDLKTIINNFSFR